MATARRKPATRTTSGSAATRRTTSSRRRSSRRPGTRATTSLYPRRRQSRPGLPTTVGTAIGTLVVTSLLDASWPVRIGLVALALVLGLGYVLWRARRDAVASADPAPVQPLARPLDGPTQTPTQAPTQPTSQPSSLPTTEGRGPVQPPS